jgi:hypothetical protein
MNTSSSADGINKDGVIVGMGVHNGETHADAMVPVTPSPTPMPPQLQLLRSPQLRLRATSDSYTKGASDAALATVIHHWHSSLTG